MTFDNSKTIIALRLRVFIATVLFVVYFYFTYFEKIIKFPIAGYSYSAWTFLLIGIYLILSFYPLILNYKYIYFSDDSPAIIFKFYSVGLFQGKKSLIEIPKRDFAGYRFNKILLGFFTSVSLQQRMDNKTVEYPPIHLSSLTRAELKKLKSALEKYQHE